MSDVEEALARQVMYGGDLVTNLLELASVSEPPLVELLAENFHLTSAPPGSLPLATSELVRLIGGEVALRYSIFPLRLGQGVLDIAVFEPLSFDVEQDLAFSLGLKIRQCVAPRVRILQAISRDYGKPLDKRTARVLAKLEGRPDPHPSVAPSAPPPGGRGLGSLPRPNSVRPTPFTQRGLGPQDLGEKAGSTLRPAAQSPSQPPPPASLRAGHRSLRPPPPRVTGGSSPGLRRIGPYTASMVERDLAEAVTRDQIVTSFFDFAVQFFEYTALFVVHGDLAEGRLAKGPGIGDQELRKIGVPLDLASFLRDAVQNRTFKLGALSDDGMDQKLARDLGRPVGRRVLVLPVNVKDRPVLLLYGDHGRQHVNLADVGDVIAVAALTGSHLERLIVARKSEVRGASPRASWLPVNLSSSKKSGAPRAASLHALVSALTEAPSPAPSPHHPDVAAFEAREKNSTLPGIMHPAVSVLPRTPDVTPAMGTPVVLSSPPSAMTEAARGDTTSTRTWPGGQFSKTPPLPLLAFDPNRGAELALALERHTASEALAEAREPTSTSQFESEPHASQKLPITQERAYQEADPEPERLQAPSLREQSPSLLLVSNDQATPIVTGETNRGASQETSGEANSATAGPDGDAFDDETETPPFLLTKSKPAQTKTEPAHAAGQPPAESSPNLQRAAEASQQESDAEPAEQPLQHSAHRTSNQAPPLPLWARPKPRQESDALPPASRSVSVPALEPRRGRSSDSHHLPTVIVDLASNCQALVSELVTGNAAAQAQLLQIGVPAASALAANLPGPVHFSFMNPAGEITARASQCGIVMRVLAKIGAQAAPFVASRTLDSDPSVRAWATHLLGEMPCEEAARAIAKRIFDTSPEVRRVAVSSGRSMQSNREARVALLDQLSSHAANPDAQLASRQASIEALEALRDSQSVAVLLPLLADHQEAIQKRAHQALITLTRSDMGPKAEVWKKWWEEHRGRHRIEWLIDALMHDSSAIRSAASEELKTLTKEYFGYYEDLPKRERARAQARYREWWESRGKARFD